MWILIWPNRQEWRKRKWWSKTTNFTEEVIQGTLFHLLELPSKVFVIPVFFEILDERPPSADEYQLHQSGEREERERERERVSDLCSWRDLMSREDRKRGKNAPVESDPSEGLETLTNIIQVPHEYFCFSPENSFSPFKARKYVILNNSILQLWEWMRMRIHSAKFKLIFVRCLSTWKLDEWCSFPSHGKNQQYWWSVFADRQSVGFEFNILS